MTIVDTLDVVCEVIKESSTHEISNWKKNMYFGYDQEIIIRNPTKYLVLVIRSAFERTLHVGFDRAVLDAKEKTLILSKNDANCRKVTDRIHVDQYDSLYFLEVSCIGDKI